MSVRIDPETWQAMLSHAGLTNADIARIQGCKRQNVWELANTPRHVGPDWVRDLGLILGEALGIEPDEVRAALFIEVPDTVPLSTRPSLIQRRLAARGTNA